jgi:hypothetical protein
VRRNLTINGIFDLSICICVNPINVFYHYQKQRPLRLTPTCLVKWAIGRSDDWLEGWLAG